MAPPHARQPTLYDILSLTPKHLEGQASTAQSTVVKKAYHRALLQHHPDKANSNTSNTSNGGGEDAGGSKSKNKSPPRGVTYTVDQIQEAYTTLSDTKKRAEYNRSLASASSSSSATTTSRQQQSSHTATFSTTRSFQTGLEVVDLDDVDFDDRKGLYFRACRCGNPRGYRFKENNLEENEDEGVLMVECLDCSLWLKVLFTAAAVDDDNDANAQSRNNQQGNQARATSSSLPQQAAQGNQSVSRNGSQGESKGGWSFKVSLGLSLGGSASASASSGRR
ncbi:diphthamide biosynthesis protein 4 [Microdochium nivale]|nr:diphthamide biosynthesis protein 4 [Microdochium nivale]